MSETQCAENCVCNKCKEKKEEIKELFEGKACGLAYNDDDDWFNDEDEEFEFTDSNKWFEKAWVDGVKERDEMLNGYKYVAQYEVDAGVKRLKQAMDEYGENLVKDCDLMNKSL
jgi:hypothetical protein